MVCYAHHDGDRVIDVGCEWRTFVNEKTGFEASRVGGPQNPLLSCGGNLSTIIKPGTGSESLNSFGSEYIIVYCLLKEKFLMFFFVFN